MAPSVVTNLQIDDLFVLNVIGLQFTFYLDIIAVKTMYTQNVALAVYISALQFYERS